MIFLMGTSGITGKTGNKRNPKSNGGFKEKNGERKQNNNGERGIITTDGGSEGLEIKNAQA